MDATRLNDMFNNIYIPSSNTKKNESVAVHHPSLVMLDNQTDTTHHLSCGCCGGCCITEQAWWAKKNTASSAAASSSPELASISRSSSVTSMTSLSSY